MHFTKDQDENEFFADLRTLPDRLVGLLAPIIVDRRLTAALKQRMVDSKISGGNTIFAELFGENGELGDMGSRAKLGLACGLFGASTYADLRLIIKIRNAFAHKLETPDFNAIRVKDWALELSIVERFPIHNPLSGSYTGDIKSPDDLWVAFLHATPKSDVTKPRDRFIRAIELLGGLLLREEMFPNPTPLNPRF